MKTLLAAAFCQTALYSTSEKVQFDTCCKQSFFNRAVHAEQQKIIFIAEMRLQVV